MVILIFQAGYRERMEATYGTDPIAHPALNPDFAAGKANGADVMVLDCSI